MLANLPSPYVMMIGLGAVIAMVVLLPNLELSNFLDVQNNKKYVGLKICIPGFGEYSCNKFPLITIRPRIREPFTLERLHLFNFLYFLYFSAGPLFLTHFSDRSSSQRRTVAAQNSELERNDSHISEQPVCDECIVLHLFLPCPASLAPVPPSPSERALYRSVHNCVCTVHATTCTAHTGRRTNRFFGLPGGAGASGGGRGGRHTTTSQLLPLGT